MSEPRLRSALWIAACVRRASVEATAVTIMRKGDPESGAILVKLNRFSAGCTVLVETRDAAGARVWYQGTGEAPVSETEADLYIERSGRRDPDLWVVEIEDRTGRLPFDARIVRL
jgi:GMP synthase (glutamine-hydrolysing)